MSSSHDDNPISAAAALARLMDGNRRFLRGEARPAADLESLASLARAQRPYATILGCSDSRVPPERVFDAGLGELFVVRVAGNVLSPEVAGSFQYAASHLGTPLFMVLGHEGCGAVAAALATKHHGDDCESRIRILLDNILPGLPEFDPGQSAGERMSCAVEANVRWMVRRVLESPEGKAGLAEGRMKIVGAVYEIETGRVRLLDAEGEAR